ncbi:MAG: DNA glycosylase AlkZ-like family protein, partial [Candidatus Thorarchaeota archaeon]
MDIRTYLGRLPARKLWNGKKAEIESYLEGLLKEGILEEVSIQGSKTRYFIHNDQINQLTSTAKLPTDDRPVKILSPFDNVIRERHYPNQIWNFDYTIECYVPEPKRVYGYFVLPILDGLELAGRMDAKVHRKTRVLEIKALYLESESVL